MQKILILYKKDEDYLEKILYEIKESEKKVCYVCFNKSPDFIIEKAVKIGLKEERLFFIDCLSSRLILSKEMKNRETISNPSDIGLIKDEIKKSVDKGYNFIVFDSLSNAISYNSNLNDKAISDFIRELENELFANEGGMLFACYEKDLGNYYLDGTLGHFNRFVKNHGIL